MGQRPTISQRERRKLAGLLELGRDSCEGGQILLEAGGFGLGGGVALLGSLDQVRVAEGVEAGDQVGHDGLQLGEFGTLESLFLLRLG